MTGVYAKKGMAFLIENVPRVMLIVGWTLLLLGIVSSPSLAQEQILSGRIPLGDLTPAQRAIVDKITRSPETANVSVIKRTGGEEQGSPENRNARVILPLSGGKEITLIRTRNTVKTERGYTWRGVAEETGERAILQLWNDGHLSGYFTYRGRVFSVNHIGDNVHTVAELQLPPEHSPEIVSTTPHPLPPEPAVAPFSETKRQALEAKKITIDLMLLYTKKAVDHYIGEPANLLALVIEEANDTFKNSGLGNISLRLVHTQLVDYDEGDSSNHFDHLYRLVDGVGAFKDVGKLRNEKRADIVGLILDSPSGCGLSTRVGANAEEAFFIAHHSCAGNTYTIVHEIGHLLGARHDRAIDANEAPMPYAHGYVNGTKWRDIMSYRESCGGCPRIPYWSNPRIMYKGEPMGTAASDNARVILEQAERVSNFR